MTHFCIFDLDGTLVNSPSGFGRYQRRAKAAGIPDSSVEAYRHFVGDGILMLLCGVRRRKASAPDIGTGDQGFDAYYASHCFDHTQPYPGCRQMLEYLSQKGVSCAVLSNKPDEFLGDHRKKLYPGFAFSSIFGKRPGYERRSPIPPPSMK